MSFYLHFLLQSLRDCVNTDQHWKAPPHPRDKEKTGPHRVEDTMSSMKMDGEGSRPPQNRVLETSTVEARRCCLGGSVCVTHRWGRRIEVWKERSRISKMLKQEPVRKRNHAIESKSQQHLGRTKRKSQRVKAKMPTPVGTHVGHLLKQAATRREAAAKITGTDNTWSSACRAWTSQGCVNEL